LNQFKKIFVLLFFKVIEQTCFFGEKRLYFRFFLLGNFHGQLEKKRKKEFIFIG
jgi:hypothetical protein